MTLTATLLVIATAMWITPGWLTSIMEYTLYAAVILWFFPSLMFA